MKWKQRQMSESFFIGALLAVTGGFLDVYTYVLKGHVFANAQTGNIVLLGLNLAEMRFDQALYYLIPILAFILGVITAEIVRRKFKEHSVLHWRQIILAAEILILAGVAFFPPGKWDMMANVSVSFICSLQVESFRKINGNAFATTMCTGNLRSATELLYRFTLTKNSGERKKSLQYYGVILFFILGAAIGALLTQKFAEKSILFCCILLAAAFLAMFIKQEEEEKMEEEIREKHKNT